MNFGLVDRMVFFFLAWNGSPYRSSAKVRGSFVYPRDPHDACGRPAKPHESDNTRL